MDYFGQCVSKDLLDVRTVYIVGCSSLNCIGGGVMVDRPLCALLGLVRTVFQLSSMITGASGRLMLSSMTLGFHGRHRCSLNVDIGGDDTARFLVGRVYGGNCQRLQSVRGRPATILPGLFDVR